MIDAVWFGYGNGNGMYLWMLWFMDGAFGDAVVLDCFPLCLSNIMFVFVWRVFIYCRDSFLDLRYPDDVLYMYSV